MWEASSTDDVLDTVLATRGSTSLLAWCPYLGEPEAGVAVRGKLVFVGTPTAAINYFETAAQA